MRDYYERSLSGERLHRCYELASPRIRRYLDAEIRFVIQRVRGTKRVLELGCGYGRVMKRLSPFVAQVSGCDTSLGSLAFATSYLKPRRNYALIRSNAAQTAFRSEAFDATVCIQNGISAFGEEPRRLVAEAIRVTRVGGQILFSTYSSRIWEERVEWFREQAREGLIGPIDEARTRQGTIVCEDGFRATTFEPSEFLRLFAGLGLQTTIHEVDSSSLFCVAEKGSARR